jgi:hypothetical protein
MNAIVILSRSHASLSSSCAMMFLAVGVSEWVIMRASLMLSSA